jgi:4-hydroxy-tetrahydrodipicolinate reductase
MKIALIGYGKMGHEIEKVALQRGHEIVCIIDMGEEEKFDSPEFRSADVAIEFTAPGSALQNYRRAFAAGLPVVSGTTGWLDHLDEIREACDKEGKTFFYASNFSLGVNIFFALNNYLAGIMNRFPDYDVRMEETHHIHKLDAPSGTAITLAEGILAHIDRKEKWVLAETGKSDELPIKAIREGEVPGIHTVIYESDADSIRIIHDARSRKGFALGAVLAAEFTKGKKGFLTMEELLDFTR